MQKSKQNRRGLNLPILCPLWLMMSAAVNDIRLSFNFTDNKTGQIGSIRI